jgi:hypothetical protein
LIIKGEESMTNAERFITRVDTSRDSKSTHGWEVRIRRKHVVIEEFFSDSKYGGWNKSCDAAREFRDQTLPKVPKMNRREIAEIRRKNFRSPRTGVSKTKSVDKRRVNIHIYWYWQAYWSPAPRMHKCKRFSINKYGNKEAYQRAVAAREKGLKEMRP